MVNSMWAVDGVARRDMRAVERRGEGLRSALRRKDFRILVCCSCVGGIVAVLVSRWYVVLGHIGLVVSWLGVFAMVLSHAMYRRWGCPQQEPQRMKMFDIYRESWIHIEGTSDVLCPRHK